MEGSSLWDFSGLDTPTCTLSSESRLLYAVGSASLVLLCWLINTLILVAIWALPMISS